MNKYTYEIKTLDNKQMKGIIYKEPDSVWSESELDCVGMNVLVDKVKLNKLSFITSNCWVSSDHELNVHDSIEAVIKDIIKQLNKIKE